MMSILLFIIVTALLVLEGALIARLILRTSDRWLLTSLGLPIAALMNVLIVFVWTIFGVLLTPLSLLTTHLLIAVLAFVRIKKSSVSEDDVMPTSRLSTAKKSLLAFCTILIAVVIYQSFAHAVLLPTFQYDSATNWTMRSEISFVDQRLAFDPTEDRGMAKPQYPFFFHALQMTANQGQSSWNDTAANTILWLLSLSAFAAVFFLLRRVMTLVPAVMTETLILGIPLLSVHLGQGYADIMLAQELLMSLATLAVWIVRNEKRWLLLSAVLVSSTVWTKSEGLFFGLLPWILVVAMIVWIDRSRMSTAKTAAGVAVGLAIPWQLFALSRGMLLTPHSSDTSFGFRPEGLTEAIYGLFDRGSFGIAWYAIVVALLWIAIELIRKKASWKNLLLSPVVWGAVVLLENLFIYLCTPNVQFLLNAESYYRQMMIPAAMLILALGIWFSQKKEVASSWNETAK